MAEYGNKHTKPQQAAIVIGIVLVLFGVWGLINAVLPGWVWNMLGTTVRTIWGILWPLALVAAGAYLLWGVKTGKFSGFTQGGASRPLRRSRADKRLLGVCGGIAYYFGIDSTVVRVMAVILLVLFTPTAIIAYFLIALLVPSA